MAFHQITHTAHRECTRMIHRNVLYGCSLLLSLTFLCDGFRHRKKNEEYEPHTHVQAVRKKIEDNKIRKLFNEDFMAFPKKLTNSASEKVKPLSDNIPLRKHMRVCGRNPQICLVSVVNVFSLPKLVSHVIIITMIIIVYPLREREAPSPYKTNARINRRISDAALRP